MDREEAIHNIAVVTDELEEIVEYRINAVYVLGSFPIANTHNYNIPIEKPTRKSYVSPYAKFDKIRRKNGK